MSALAYGYTSAFPGANRSNMGDLAAAQEDYNLFHALLQQPITQDTYAALHTVFIRLRDQHFQHLTQDQINALSTLTVQFRQKLQALIDAGAQPPMTPRTGESIIPGAGLDQKWLWYGAGALGLMYLLKKKKRR